MTTCVDTMHEQMEIDSESLTRWKLHSNSDESVATSSYWIPQMYNHVIVKYGNQIATLPLLVTPRAHAQQGVKQSFCPSVVVVVVVVNTKMARSA